MLDNLRGLGTIEGLCRPITLGYFIRLGVVPESSNHNCKEQNQSTEDIDLLGIFVLSDDRGRYLP